MYEIYFMFLSFFGISKKAHLLLEKYVLLQLYKKIKALVDGFVA